MKRNIIFAVCAIMTGVFSLAGILFMNFFYPQIYEKNDSGEYVNIETVNKQSTFPVTKDTIFEVQYYYPDEDRLLSEQLKSIPELLGFDKDRVEEYLRGYTDHMTKDEKEKGLVSYEMISYKDNTITLRKTFRKQIDTGFYAKSFNGYVVILNGDEKTVFEYTEIAINTLPDNLREDVLEGYYIASEEELYSFLENYTS